MTVNIMVGSGIMIGPQKIAALAGNASFLAWLIVAAVFLPMVLTTVKMSRMCPGSGGFYAYAKEGLSKRAAYWSGWIYITGYTFVVAVEILALRETLFAVLGEQWQWFTGNLVLFNTVLFAITIGLNLLGLRMFSRILNALTVSKVIPIVVLILLIPFILNPSFTVTSAEVSMLPYALPMAIFGFFGFEYACSISHLVENGERNAPLAILIGFSVTSFLYALFHFGLLNLMGAPALAQYGAPMYAEYITLPIPYLKAFLSVIIPVASACILFAGAIGVLNANAIMMHAMAEEKLFHGWPLFIKMTSWYRPWATILFQGIIAWTVATLLPIIVVVGNLCNMTIASSFILPFISLLMVQKRTGRHGSSHLTILALVIAVLLSAYSIYVLAPTMTSRLMYLLPLLALLGVGAALYRRETPSVAR